MPEILSKTTLSASPTELLHVLRKADIAIDGLTIIGGGTSADPFRIKISSKPGNAIQVITGSLDPAEDGLFIEPLAELNYWDDRLFWIDTETWEDRP